MFTRDSKPPRIDTLIGRTSRVQGDVEFEGGMHLDGEVCGAVRADPVQESSLTVSESGAVLGAVQVRNLILNGTVKGDIHAPGRLVLGATAKVEGNVYYGIIEMTLGAQIVGKLVRLEPAEPVVAPQEGPG
jgi:cytoskeletal protein CcmA (bactofilin family)